MNFLKTLAVSLIVSILAVVGGGLGIFGPLGAHLPSAGALTGPDIPSPYLRWGGVARYGAAVNLAASASVPCSIQNPTSATSTLTSFSARINTNGIAADQTFDLATSSTATGTSSPAFIRAGTITGSKQKDIAWLPGIASTTNAGVIGTDRFLSTGESPYLVGPSEYVNLKIATGTPGTFAAYYGGNCSATFVPLQQPL